MDAGIRRPDGNLHKNLENFREYPHKPNIATGWPKKWYNKIGTIFCTP